MQKSYMSYSEKKSRNQPIGVWSQPDVPEISDSHYAWMAVVDCSFFFCLLPAVAAAGVQNAGERPASTRETIPAAEPGWYRLSEQNEIWT